MKTSATIIQALQIFGDEIRIAKREMSTPSPTDKDDLKLELTRKLKTLIVTISNHSNLILDPDLDSYYLMDQSSLKLPDRFLILEELQVTLGKISLEDCVLNKNEMETVIRLTSVLPRQTRLQFGREFNLPLTEI